MYQSGSARKASWEPFPSPAVDDLHNDLLKMGLEGLELPLAGLFPCHATRVPEVEGTRRIFGDGVAGTQR